MFGQIIKRFCHHHDKNITSFLRNCNPLIECEKKCNTTHLEKNIKQPYIEETKIYIENGTLIHSQSKYLPIQIQYVDNNNKIHKVLIHFIYLASLSSFSAFFVISP